MNKLLMFPLAFMFLLSVFTFAYTGITLKGSSQDYSDQGGVTVQNESGSVDIPQAGSHEYNIWESDSIGALVILLSAIAIGIVAGITVLGSGLKEFSQSLIFQSILFLGLWACLTVITSYFMFQNEITSIFWISLTTIFVMGFGIHVTAPSGG